MEELHRFGVRKTFKRLKIARKPQIGNGSENDVSIFVKMAETLEKCIMVPLSDVLKMENLDKNTEKNHKNGLQFWAC